MQRGVTGLVGIATLAVAIAVFIDGGLGDEVRAVFAGLAGAALLVALAVRPERTLWAARAGPVLVLAGFAALIAASALWTVGDPAAAVRWGVTVAGFAALTAVGAVIAAHRAGLAALAAVLAIVAVAAGLEALAGVAFRDQPLALRLAGEWQAAGPFEYPPALALVQVAALPALLAGMLRFRRGLAGASAGAMTIALLAILLSSNRTASGFAVAAIAGSIVFFTGAPRRLTVAAWLTALIPSFLVVLVLAPGDPGSPLASGAARASVLAALVLSAVLAWPLIRARLQRRSDPPTPPRRVLAPRGVATAGLIVVATVTALTVAATTVSEPTGPGVEPTSGFLHGRSEQWRAALETAGDRPLLGAGGEAYYIASLAEQGRDAVLYAHSLPLEAAAELGAVGAGLVLLLYLSSGLALWRARTTAALPLLGPAVLAFMLANLIDWHWHLAGVSALWALALGGVIGAPAARMDGGNPRTRVGDALAGVIYAPRP